MLVRLALAWTDPFGIAHGVGELVDIDAVTLAELEEQGVVENMTEIQPTPDQPQKAWVGPGAPPAGDKAWVGPGAPPAGDKAWVGPGAPPADDPDAETDDQP
ncbi:hypothetical protein [Catellatospora citrea]|uniref:Uncharacterized protein n=1 Tax=Catellatospora citrea TaxID=53366 RepID=A0A8J3NWP8_9ACTN|nr:hypothetical protein [Catellatospora citrea]RKE07170.1 hypothetical protein C8E86_1995 [Catellatospora citrea]GIF95322.1 hypothetical protein Cci01nite_04160 [Catellatospora citrea]